MKIYQVKLSRVVTQTQTVVVPTDTALSEKQLFAAACRIAEERRAAWTDDPDIAPEKKVAFDHREVRLLGPGTEPQVGDVIYIADSWYIGRGEDVCGGIATINQVKMGMSAGNRVPFVSVNEVPGHSYNWEFLAARQEELAHRFGSQLAHLCPDR